MVRICVIDGCKSEYYPDCGLSYHRIPGKETAKQSWLNALKLQNSHKQIKENSVNPNLQSTVPKKNIIIISVKPLKMATAKLYHEIAIRIFSFGNQNPTKLVSEKKLTCDKIASKPPPPPSEPQKAFPMLRKTINGGIAGVIGISIVFPLDLVKTRLQNQTIGPKGEKQYKNIFDCFKKTMKAEGYFGMYRGSLINILLVTPEKGLKFAVNDLCLFHLQAPDGYVPYSYQAFAGAMAGAFQCLITTPMELVKIQMQDAGRVAAQASAAGKAYRHRGVFELVGMMLRERGLFGLYKGISPTACRDIFTGVVYFPMVQAIDSNGPAEPGQKQPFWWSMIAGFSSGAAAAVIVNPFDVMKTRMQTLTKGKGERHYKSIMECFTDTLKREGPKAFLKGSLCRMIVLGPLYGIAQAVYFFGVADMILGIQ